MLDRHVPVLDIAHLTEATRERRGEAAVTLRRLAAEEPDHRHRLLRTGERGRGERAGEGEDHLAPPHSMTSWACASFLFCATIGDFPIDTVQHITGECRNYQIVR